VDDIILRNYCHRLQGGISTVQNIQNTFFLESLQIPTRPIGATIPKNITQTAGVLQHYKTSGSHSGVTEDSNLMGYNAVLG
jgi:hypothetical protein